MYKLGTVIRDQLDTWTSDYDRRLQEIPDYGNMPAQVRFGAARQVLSLVVECLADDKDDKFVRFIESMAAKRIEQGLESGSLLQTLVALEATLQPHVTDAQTAKFLWGMLSKGRDAAVSQATAVLRASESRLRQMVDHSPVGFFHTTPDGRMADANQALLQIVGYDSLEAVNRVGVPSLYQDPAERQRLLALLQQGPVTGFETNFRRADGQIINVLLNARLMQEAGEVTYLEGILEDITQRKQVEAALRESEERFRRFEQVTAEGLLFHEQGKIIDANAALIALFGFSDASEAIGKNLLEFIAPESRETVVKQMQSGSPLPYEAVAIRKDGTTFPVEAAGRLYEYQGRTLRVGAIRDITERKRMEQQIQETSLKFREMVDRALVGIFRTTPAGQIVDANPVLLKTLRFDTIEQANQVGLLNLYVDEADRHRLLAELRQGPVSGFETRFRRGDGEIIPISIGAHLVLDEKGAPQLIEGTLEDITERKQAEAALRESEERFRNFEQVTAEGLIFHEQGKIIDANAALIALFGFSDASEAIGKNLLEFIAPESRETVVKQMQSEGWDDFPSRSREPSLRAPGADHSSGFHPRHHRAQASRGITAGERREIPFCRGKLADRHFHCE
jgi:PAS domain S-box-containing protein